MLSLLSNAYAGLVSLAGEAAEQTSSGWFVDLWNKLRDDFINNFIAKDRYTYLLKGLGITFEVTFFAPLLGIFLGIVVALMSFAGIIYALVSAAMGNIVEGWTSMTCIICFVSGIQMISLGVIGEYVGKIYLETKRRPRYIIDESKNMKEATEE